MAKSKCCGAKIRVIGKTTMHYECYKCGKPCDIIISIRKEWKMNPETRVQSNKKKDYKPNIEE
jgi:hypothetical protein